MLYSLQMSQKPLPNTNLGMIVLKKRHHHPTSYTLETKAQTDGICKSHPTFQILGGTRSAKAQSSFDP